MRVMFWLSRASAPLWWDSNYASNDPLLRHPALPAVFTYQSLEYRERTKHTVELSSCQHVERNDFGALAPVLEHERRTRKAASQRPCHKLRAGCSSVIATASRLPQARDRQ